MSAAASSLQGGVGGPEGGEEVGGALLETGGEGGQGLPRLVGEGVGAAGVGGEGGGPGVGDAGDGFAEARGEAVELGFDAAGELRRDRPGYARRPLLRTMLTTMVITVIGIT